MTVRSKSLARVLSLLLALSMLLSMSVLSSAAQPASLTLSDDTLTLMDKDQAFAATLTVDATLLDGADPTEWAQGLTWYLTRDEAFQDTEIYPYYYTGDKLDQWQKWNNGAGGEALFTLGEVTARTEGGTVIVTLPFTADAFIGINGTSTSNRNVWPSFIGPYTFSVQDGDEVLASTGMTVNAYDSYTRYDDVDEKIQAIIDEALPGRYITVTTFGQSEGGRDQYYVTLSDSKSSVDAFQQMNAIAETDPASLMLKLDNGTLGDYRIPLMLNNVHPDEDPGVDAQLDLLRDLATQETITYNTLTGFLDEDVDISAMFAKDVVDLGITGLGSQKFTKDEEGNIQNNTGVNDASELYTISEDITLKVDDILDDIIFVIIPNENPDGRTYNARRNDNGFDLNRDASNQTQSETTNLVTVINDWNPVAFVELHGYMDEFLVEPCTPPHEPNLEYDLLVKNFALGAEAFGTAALGTMSATREDHPDTLFWSYYTPLRDDYDPETMHWSAWDDLCTNYGPSYAMLNCGAMGYTIETPYSNQASTDLFRYGLYGLIDYVQENKADIYRNQLEFFRRGIENEDHRADMEKWYVDVNNNQLAEDTWRVPYAQTGNYFPEYYVIPVDAASQRDVADAYEMGQFLLRNGVLLSKLTEDTYVDGVTYKAGSLVVDMYQAKRNYANAVLWEGADASNSGFPELYSESVSNFPAMRGFDCTALAVKGAFDGKLEPVYEVTGVSQLSGTEGDYVILDNSGNAAVRAVNALLDDGQTVGMITSGDHKGDFLVSYEAFQSFDNLVLTGTRVSELPEAYAISKPTIFLAGRYDDFSGHAVTEGYFSKWFSEGYGFINYRNVYSNGTSNYDVMAFVDQLGFTVTDDPAQADIILGNVALNQGESGEAAVAAVKAGTPYIATGSSPLAYISENLVTDLKYDTLGMEALHTVTYPTDSLVTASYVADGDYVTYTYNCGVITQVPEGAQVLIRAADKDSFIAGCCLNDAGTVMDGLVEAFALQRDGMDLTIFANSVNNRAHQQDDYRYVTNTIYAKMLSDEPITDLSGYQGYTDVADDHWAASGIEYVTVNGLMGGTGDGVFSPAMALSRGMLVTILYRQEGAPEVEPSTFPDVAEGQWYSEGVAWAAANQVVTGYDTGLYGPNDSLTREQIATILYRYAKFAGMDTSATADLSSFPDGGETSGWAAEGLSWAVGEGIINGKDGGKLDPTGEASRAEAAVMLQRFLES